MLLRIEVGAVAILAAILVSACATPDAQRSSHRGFFESLSSEGSSSGISSSRSTHTRRGPSFVREEPAAPVAKARAVEPSEKSESAATKSPKIDEVRASAVSWRWPLDRVRMTSGFGDRGSAFHEGVDLAAAVGTPVFAVDGGKVVFAGSKIRGYGRMVILKHPNSGLLTVYAHLSRPLVKRGQAVAKGQKIAFSGQTGRTSGPHLHFEVRKGVTAFDPTKVLMRPHRTSVVAKR